MRTEEFNAVVESRIEKIRSVLASKAVEYSKNDDRHHNFKEGARIFNCTPERHLMFLNSKHLISINDMVTGFEEFHIAPRNEIERELEIAKWEEKIGDAINYLILLEGLVKERIIVNQVGVTLSPDVWRRGSRLEAGDVFAKYAECSYGVCPTQSACLELCYCQRPKSLTAK